MPPVYASSLKSTRMQAVIAAIDADANPATIEIGTTAFGTILATITLQKPSFSESGGVITMLGAPFSANATNSGQGVVARIKTGNTGTVVVTNLSVGTIVGGYDIALTTTQIIALQNVQIQGGTITHA
jgi:hypothetical protein